MIGNTKHPLGCLCDACDLTFFALDHLDETKPASRGSDPRVGVARIAVPEPEELTIQEKIAQLKERVDIICTPGVCYFCSVGFNQVVGRLKGFGGLICQNCALKHLFGG